MNRAGFQSLVRILQPYSLEDFLASDWGTTHRYVPGWPGKFSDLLPWERLNKILQQHRFDFPRLRLTREGERLAPQSYLRHSRGSRHKAPVPRLQHAEITRQLSLGATLVLDGVDELYEPLTELASSLELFFRERIQINSYAGWRTSRGFDIHWDDHDVFILQVTGRKRWAVYRPTRLYPVAGDSKDFQPTEPPLWDEILNDGDLLYIPRGFWHVAFPVDEPTLHLTVGVHNRTALDLMRWLTERMRVSETFRQDLPRFGTEEIRLAHLSKLREELSAELADDLLSRYFTDLDNNAPVRPRLSLPWSATAEILPESPQTRIRLLAPRPLVLRSENGSIEFCSQKKRWRFSEKAFVILQTLETERVCSVEQLCLAAQTEVSCHTVIAFVKELIVNGLVAVVPN